MVSQNGGSRVVAIYAKKLVAMGHDVTVVSRAPKEESLPRRIFNRAKGTARPNPNRTAFFDDLGDRHIQIPWKFPLEATDVPDADIVIATWWRTAFEVAALPREKGRKAYFVQHHEVHQHQPWDLAGGSYYLPLSKITIADWLVQTMAERYGDPGVPKVENSVDTDHFQAPERSRNAIPRVGLLYSDTPFKGVDTSLKAIEIARRKFPDLQILAFGSKNPTEKLPMPKGTEFHRLPAQDLLPALYAKCDVWLCGSQSEGFHLPPLEAMACRTPVVAGHVGGTTEVIEDGVNGYIVANSDAEALGARLSELLEKSPDEWRKMSDAAHARAHSYSWDDAARAFEAELLKIAGQG